MHVPRQGVRHRRSLDGDDALDGGRFRGLEVALLDVGDGEVGLALDVIGIGLLERLEDLERLVDAAGHQQRLAEARRRRAEHLVHAARRAVGHRPPRRSCRWPRPPCPWRRRRGNRTRPSRRAPRPTF